MEGIQKIDSAVPAFFIKWSHRLQRLTGYTNFFFAKVMAYVMAVGYMVRLGNYWFPVLAIKTYLADVFILSFCLLWLFGQINVCDQADKSASQEERIILGERVRISSFPFRLFTIACSLFVFSSGIFSIFQPKGFLVFKLAWALILPAFVSFACLIAVDLLPPAKSKVREWVESFSAGKFKTAEAYARD